MEGRKVSTKGRHEDLGCPKQNHRTGQDLASVSEQKQMLCPERHGGRGEL